MPAPWTLIVTIGFLPTNHDWRVPEKFLVTWLKMSGDECISPRIPTSARHCIRGRPPSVRPHARAGLRPATAYPPSPRFGNAGSRRRSNPEGVTA
jgi:hypothetical protein